MLAIRERIEPRPPGLGPRLVGASGDGTMEWR